MVPPNKILIIKLRSMGDTIILTATLGEVRRQFPRSEIHVVVTSPWDELLQNHPAINHLWTYHRRDQKPARAKAIAGLALKLRREKFDCVINLHASPSSSTLAFATGAPLRSVHFHGHQAKNRFSTVEIPGKGVIKPIIERDMDALRGLGVDAPVGAKTLLKLTEREIELAKEKFKELQLKSPVMGIAIGASRPTKIWPGERFHFIAAEWTKQTGGSVVLISGPGDERCLEELGTHQFVHFKKLGLRELASRITQLSFLLANDSGPRHLAVALSVPTVTLFGPEHPLEWHPYDRELHPYFFVEDLDCRRDADPGFPAWCGLTICEEYQHRCMTKIDPKEVLETCFRIARI